MLNQVSQKNLEITTLQNTIENLEAQKSQAESSLQSISGENQNELRQYQTLVEIMEAYQNEDFTEAAKLYAGWSPELIADEGMQEFVIRIRTDMEATGYQVLADLGNEARDAGNMVTALDYYQKSLEIKADNPQVLYDMANVYNSAGEEEKAKELWGRVIMEYPDTDLAAAAKESRGY